MLTFRARLDDLTKMSANDLSTDASRVLEFFDHALIMRSEAIVDNGYEIWIGESDDPFSADESCDVRHSKTRRNQDFDAIRITAFAAKSGPRVTVCRTSAGTSPLYISAEGSQICVSWKFEVAVSNLHRPKANVRLCRLVLEHGKGQSREQIIEGVYALWAGEEVNFDNSGLRFSDCEGLSVALPSSFEDRACASDAFLETIASVMRPVLTGARRPLLELSGGMDSTCVAIAASSVRTGLESFGVIHPGGVGRQQRARRQELIELLGLTDYTAASSFMLPIQSLSIGECQVTPNDEVYRICMMNVLRENGVSDADVVISGLGGDELTMVDTFRRMDWEVPGHVCASSIGGAMSHADMYMRKGIWLLNPLCHPAVVNLCRAMPIGMRANRLLHRLSMARAGLSDGYMTPRFHETFANVLMLEGVEGDFDHILDNSILPDLGILDTSRLLSMFHESTELGVSAEVVGKVYHAAKLDLTLKNYL